MITREKFRKFLDELWAGAKEIVRAEGGFDPTVFGFDHSGHLQSVRIPVLEEGASYAAAIKQVITGFGLQAFAFVSEGWMLTFPLGPEAEIRKSVPKTCQHPSRAEMLSIIGIHPEYRETRRLPMEKDKTHGVLFADHERRAQGAAVVGAVADTIPLVQRGRRDRKTRVRSHPSRH